MKYLQYNILQSVSEDGTPNLRIKELSWSEENEQIAKKEAYDGYTLAEDGRPDPAAQPTEEARIAQLEAALELLLSGVTE